MTLFDRWQYNLALFLDQHRGPVLLLSGLFVIGVLFGALAVRSLDGPDQQELVQYLGANLEELGSLGDQGERLLLKRSLGSGARLLGLLWVLGISVVGAPGVMVLALLRGFVSGFVVAFLAAQLSWKGVLVALAAHLPHTLLEVPALILAGAAAMGLSLKVLEAWRARRRMLRFYPWLSGYTLQLAGVGLLLIGASLVESYLSPTLIELTLKLMEIRP